MIFCRDELGIVHENGQFVISSLYKQVTTRKILIELQDVKTRPCLIGNSAYVNILYMLKNYKPTNLDFVDMIKFGFGRVVIEQTFIALKNRWSVVNGFMMAVEKATVVTYRST